MAGLRGDFDRLVSAGKGTGMSRIANAVVRAPLQMCCDVVVLQLG
jgi:hypothetical protein